MPNSYVEITSNGSASQALAFSFPYLNQTDIGVTVNGVVQTLTTHWSFATTQSIVFVSHPANGAVIRISRTTPSATRVVDFQDGSVLSEADLDNSADQIFFIAQEAADTAAQSIILGTDAKWEAQSKPIKNVTNPTNAQDAVTKNYLENTWLSTSDKTQLNNLNTTNLNTVAGSVSNVNTVAGAVTNLNTVAGAVTNVNTVAGKNTELGLLGTSGNVSNMDDIAATGVISNIATVAGAVSAVTTVSGAVTNVNTVSGNITNVNSLASALGTITTFAVTVASVGGTNKFHIDGVAAPTLSLFRGNTYTFDLSNSSNSGHPLIFKTSAGAGYTTGVVTTGTAGTSGAKVTFTIAADAPAALVYACSVHGNGMGNTIAVSSSNLSTVASNISSVNTNATNIANINTVAGVSSSLAGAAGNATAAANSATAAANSAAAAATALDSFDDRYLGSKSSEPSVDNDGNALVSGALYFNSTSNGMKVYDGANWINASSAGSISLLDYEYTATAGQTTFSGSDNNSATLAYAAGNLIVTLNGIVLDNGSDYTSSSGTSIVLASGAALNDHLAVVAFKSFTAADTVPASTGGTFAGNVAVTGTISTTGKVALPATLGSANQVLTVNSGASAAAWASPAVGFAHTLNSGNPAITTNPLAIGHMWVNTTNGETFVCTDATNNANVWVPIGRTTGGNIAPFSATGGIVSTSGSYTVHTFLSTANFVTTATKGMEYLVVAGGGSGGTEAGGGGGAGGLLQNVGGTALSVISGTYPIVVGAGGTAPSYSVAPTNGSNSSALGLTAIGGGVGSVSQTNVAGNGGSGGGAAFVLNNSNGVAGTGISGQGNDGGGPITWNNNGQHATAGGGGAGAVGVVPSGQSTPSGAGGAGLQINIDGNNYYYAAGGGGSSLGGTGGNGGIGGGGAGAAHYNGNGTSGTGGASARNSGGSPISSSLVNGGAAGANTGSGGGGATTQKLGGTGGSGIVIIRYLT